MTKKLTTSQFADIQNQFLELHDKMFPNAASRPYIEPKDVEFLHKMNKKQSHLHHRQKIQNLF